MGADFVSPSGLMLRDPPYPSAYADGSSCVAPPGYGSFTYRWSIVLVLNEMVLVLEARGSSTSTSTAGAEYEYEIHGTHQ
jgi:hypothetical protein